VEIAVGSVVRVSNLDRQSDSLTARRCQLFKYSTSIQEATRSKGT
ncbi:hypothetical protein LSAT2_019583, partial [Lamellibrachia satsuma]